MRGEVVVVPFPFSDLQGGKRRPALVLIDLPGPDAVLAAITSTANEPNTIPLNQTDFRTGKLDHPSFIHPMKLFTAEKTLIARTVGSVTETKRKEVVAKLVQLLE
jgi:mRNA interferase MazF